VNEEVGLYGYTTDEKGLSGYEGISIPSGFSVCFKPKAGSGEILRGYQIEVLQ